MKKIYYEKIGRRYVPVREYDPDFMDAFPKGTHLVVCRPGSTSHSYDIDPAIAPMLAAGKYAEDDMCAAIVKTMEYKPKKQPITERQRELWQELKKSFADADFVIRGISAHEATRAGIKALGQEVEKMLEVPAVRLAYEQFMLVWKLTKENEKQ